MPNKSVKFDLIAIDRLSEAMRRVGISADQAAKNLAEPMRSIGEMAARLAKSFSRSMRKIEAVVPHVFAAGSYDLACLTCGHGPEAHR